MDFIGIEMTNKLNRNDNTSRNRLNRDRDNVFGKNEWFNGLDLF